MSDLDKFMQDARDAMGKYPAKSAEITFIAMGTVAVAYLARVAAALESLRDSARLIVEHQKNGQNRDVRALGRGLLMGVVEKSACVVCDGISDAPPDATTFEAYTSGVLLGVIIGAQTLRGKSFDFCDRHVAAFECARDIAAERMQKKEVAG